MAEKLCPDCGREVCCGQATVPDAATLDCHGGAQCLRLAYAREKARAAKLEGLLREVKAGWLPRRADITKRIDAALPPETERSPKEKG